MYIAVLHLHYPSLDGGRWQARSQGEKLTPKFQEIAEFLKNLEKIFRLIKPLVYKPKTYFDLS